MAEVAAPPPLYRLFCASWSEFRPETGLHRLPQTMKSARALAEALANLGALEDDPVMLADRDGISCISAIEDFLALPGENLIMYLASHGLVSGGTNPYYRLATGDTRRLDDVTRSLPLFEVTELLTTSDAARKLLLVDACYSARAGAGTFNRVFSEDAIGDAVCLLASSGPFETSLAPSDAKLTTFVESLIVELQRGVPTQTATVSIAQVAEAMSQARDDAPRPALVAQGSASRTIVFPNAAVMGAVRVPAAGGQVAPSDYRAEILFVDDEAEFRDEFRASLERVGHHVVLADGPRQAARQLRSSHFDIVVVDLLQTGDLPAKDLLAVCNEEAGDALVFLVSRRDANLKAENWEQLHAIFPFPNRIAGFLWKPGFAATVKKAADNILDRRKNILSRVHELEDAIPLVVGRMIRRDKGLTPRSEKLQLEARIAVEHLVTRWFEPSDDAARYIDHFALAAVDSGRSVCSVFTLTPVLVGLQTENVAPLVLKIGPAEEIREEERRYDRYVQVGVPLDFRTDKIGSASVGDVGAILYSFRGGRLDPLKEVGQLTSDEVGECLDVLFDPTEGKKWLGARAAEDVMPLEHFRELGYDEFMRATNGLRATLGSLRGEAANDDSAAAIEALWQAPVMLRHHPATLVHGDLNLGNLVRTGPSRYAMIDYRTVGFGPRCVDFATIEVSCWLTAQAPPGQESDLFADARTAIVGAFRDDRADSEIPEWLRGVWMLAQKCRDLAYRNFKDEGFTEEEYASLLWLAAVRRAEFKSSAKSAPEKRSLKVLPPALAIAAQEMVAQAQRG